jgi:hypothetical protein
MRHAQLIALLLVVLTLSSVLAQEGKRPDPQEGDEKIPATLAEAHAELERILPPEELAKIDAMKSEDEMIQYHHGLGTSLRNAWGLWRGSPLRDHLKELGFTHPDDMSSVILETFWCKRHGKDFRLKERAEKYAVYWEASRKARADGEARFKEAEKAMASMMMGLEFEKREPPVLRMPDRTGPGERARFLSAFRDGVFLALRNLTGPKDEDFVTRGFYYDGHDPKIREIRVSGLDDVQSAVTAGSTAWFAGVAGGKPILLRIAGGERASVPLPVEQETPQLGLDRENLLVVYPRAVYRLAGSEWAPLYSGELLLPRSGPPPRLHGNMLFFRDEGHFEDNKRLWWLTLGKEPSLVSLDRDVKLVGPRGSWCENSFSYDVAEDGALWATAGSFEQSLLRRSKDGIHGIAILRGSLLFAPWRSASRGQGQTLTVSAVEVLPDGSILLVGRTGLYRLKGKLVSPEVLFTNTEQKIPIHQGRTVYHWNWDPSHVLALGPDAYFISGDFGGIYLLRKSGDGRWSFESLDETLGEPVAW